MNDGTTGAMKISRPMEREKAPVCDSARLGGFTFGFDGNFIWALSRYFLINCSFGASAHRCHTNNL